MFDPQRKRTCFVIMPFGEKTDFDGQAIDFDDIYRFFFKKAIEDIGIECIRCDEIDEAGSIHDKMFAQIYQADVVVVDITTSNANVYYELGIRHALAKGVTVLIRRKGTSIPFNIQGLQVVEYDQAKFASIEGAKVRIRQIIANGLDSKVIDSPVHEVLDLNIEPDAKPLTETRVHKFRLKDSDDVVIGLITGDIQNIRSGVDVWVNPENIHMQMARPFENSISGVIRYHGAETRDDGTVKDTIAEALAAELNERSSVNPAEILVTTSGALEKSHRVKRIIHVAANVGQVGKGYTPIADVAPCIVNALSVTQEDLSGDGEQCEVQSILIPLIGTRPRRATELHTLVEPLLDAAIDHLIRDSDCLFREVYFLNYTDKEFETCRELLHTDPRLTPLVQGASTVENPDAGTRATDEAKSTPKPPSGKRPKPKNK